MKKFNVIIIGAGAGGMVCAIRAAARGRRVLLLERDDRVGKKLLSTGNGHCNMGNVAPIEGKYNTDFVKPVLGKYDVAYQRDFFESLGLFTRVKDGRVYPYSMQATTVNNVLRRALETLKVSVITGVAAENVRPTDGGYCVNGQYYGEKVVLATGGPVGSGHSGHGILTALGHTSSRLLPGLVPLITDTSRIRGLRGVRIDVGARLLVDGRIVSETIDEVIFKDNGLSGTAIFTLSRAYAALGGRNGVIELDFMPDYSREEVQKIVKKIGDLEGLFHKEVARNISLASRGDLVGAIKSFRIEDVRLGSSELAQITCGGLNTDEFSSSTLESKKHLGIYAIGEALDVDGECGGYNLMWAFGSALAVGDNV